MFSRRAKTLATAASLATLTAAAAAFDYFPLIVAKETDDDRLKKKIVIIGGGTAGVGIAAQLINQGIYDVTVIEPKRVHYYQPLWTLVGAGMKKDYQSEYPMKQVLSKRAIWLSHSVSLILPHTNEVELEDGERVSYDYLVVAAGCQSNWKSVPGLYESVGQTDSGVVSIYHYDFCSSTWEAFKNFKGGRAIFTQPATPIKCAGAPQKIMWLFEEYVKDKKMRQDTEVGFWIPGAAMFGVDKYSRKLTDLAQERDVDVRYKQELIKIDRVKKMASFKNLDTGKISQEKFDLLHVVPPMSAPDFINKSLLRDSKGWMDVNKFTLQSVKFKNIFGLGDCTNTPNSKSAAAVMSQAPVVVRNLQKEMKGEKLDAVYNGYGSCPIMVNKNRVILAEFGYDGEILETFSHETGKFPLNLIGQEGYVQEYLFACMKKHWFPFAYWFLYPRSMWYGSAGFFRPNVTADSKKSKKI